MMKPAARFLCPRCAQPGDFAMRCPTCEVPLVEAGALPPWSVHGLASDWTLPPRWGVMALYGALSALGSAGLGIALSNQEVIQLIALPLLLLINVFVLLRVISFPNRRHESSDSSVVAVFGALDFVGLLVAAWLHLVGATLETAWVNALIFGLAGVCPGMYLARVVSYSISGFLVYDPNVSSFEAVSYTPIHHASEGKVAVVGRVQTDRSAVMPDGTLCAAYELRFAGGRSLSVRTGGGVLQLDDGSGSSARVMGEWVRVLDGLGHTDRAVILDGAEVEVLGTARWTTSGQGGAPLRGGARVLEITGTSERPVVLRTRSPAVAPAPGVRIAAAPSVADEGAGAAEDAAVAPERQGGHSRAAG